MSAFVSYSFSEIVFSGGSVHEGDLSRRLHLPLRGDGSSSSNLTVGLFVPHSHDVVIRRRQLAHLGAL